MAPARHASAFSKGLGETGYVDAQDVMVEYHWLGGQTRATGPALMADLVRRRVAVIATPGSAIGCPGGQSCDHDDPDRLRRRRRPGQARSGRQPRPAGRQSRPASIFSPAELAAKRLGLLHELVPKAVRIAVLVNPANAPTAESHAARHTGSRPCNRTANSGPQRQHQPRDRGGLRHPRARPRRRSLRRRPTGSSPAGASNLRRSRRAMGFPRPIHS